MCSNYWLGTIGSVFWEASNFDTLDLVPVPESFFFYILDVFKPVWSTAQIHFYCWFKSGIPPNPRCLSSLISTAVFSVKANQLQIYILMPNDNWLADAEIHCLGHIRFLHQMMSNLFDIQLRLDQWHQCIKVQNSPVLPSSCECKHFPSGPQDQPRRLYRNHPDDSGKLHPSQRGNLHRPDPRRQGQVPELTGPGGRRWEGWHTPQPPPLH